MFGGGSGEWGESSSGRAADEIATQVGNVPMSGTSIPYSVVLRTRSNMYEGRRGEGDATEF